MELLPVAPLETLRSRRSEKWRTYPDDVLPLPVAEMDFDLAPPVAAALREAVDRSDTGYPAAVPVLGKALAGFAGERWGWDVDPAAVTAVVDVGVGVVELLRVLARPGDPVVFCPPVYPPFFDWVPEAGARAHEVPLVDGCLDLAGLRQAFAAHPAVFLLCNPHNPVGRVHRGLDARVRRDLHALAGLRIGSDRTLTAQHVSANIVRASTRSAMCTTGPRNGATPIQRPAGIAEEEIECRR